MYFKGHTGKIKCLTWSRDDTLLLSCGSDGMCFVWKIDSDLGC